MSWDASGTVEMVPPAPSGPTSYAGAVLVGGASRRFGSDKVRHVWRGRTLLEHALASLESAEDVLVVGAASASPEPGRFSARWIADVRPGFGALSGVHAALVHAERAWVAVLGCDMPCVPRALWTFLLERTGDHGMVVPEGPAGLEPLAAIYHVDAVTAIEAVMDRGGGPLHELPRHVPGTVVPWADVRERFHAGIFLNANRPGDLPSPGRRW